MTETAGAMTALDAIVAARPSREQYGTACALYEAARAGLLEVPIPQQALYGWVLKWATVPERRGVVIAGLVS